MSDFVKLHARHFNFRQFISNALAEDVGDGDHTSLSTISLKQKGKMHLLAKEEGIIAGVEAAKKIFSQIDRAIKFNGLIKDGTFVKKGDIVFTVEGNTRNLLKAERLVLNIMQRMSGIATKTHHLQGLCPPK
jgi:nicotinate-nucleotide pyrophosphorylase (carboxylating)